jgi:hypothetical protein
VGHNSGVKCTDGKKVLITSLLAPSLLIAPLNDVLVPVQLLNLHPAAHRCFELLGMAVELRRTILPPLLSQYRHRR